MGVGTWGGGMGWGHGLGTWAGDTGWGHGVGTRGGDMGLYFGGARCDGELVRLTLAARWLGHPVGEAALPGPASVALVEWTEGCAGSSCYRTAWRHPWPRRPALGPASMTAAAVDWRAVGASVDVAARGVEVAVGGLRRLTLRARGLLRLGCPPLQQTLSCCRSTGSGLLRRSVASVCGPSAPVGTPWPAGLPRPALGLARAVAVSWSLFGAALRGLECWQGLGTASSTQAGLWACGRTSQCAAVCR